MGVLEHDSFRFENLVFIVSIQNMSWGASPFSGTTFMFLKSVKCKTIYIDTAVEKHFQGPANPEERGWSYASSLDTKSLLLFSHHFNGIIAVEIV